MDHVVPLARGGMHQPWNIQPLCRTCNQVKHLRIIAFDHDGGGIELSDVVDVIGAVVDGRLPLEVIRLNYPFLNQQAQALKSTMAIPGLEAFEEGSLRAKSTRGNR